MPLHSAMGHTSALKEVSRPQLCLLQVPRPGGQQPGDDDDDDDDCGDANDDISPGSPALWQTAGG